MKKSNLLIGIGIAMMALALFNLSLSIDSKAHYFANGIICGIGMSLIAVQILQRRAAK